jgi:1-acyl-sn-glycerol-3-phosphate acyltransferase
MDWENRTACMMIKADRGHATELWQQLQDWKPALGAWETTGEWDYLIWLDTNELSEENYILAPNHISNLDPPSFGATIPREWYFLGKAALFKNPLFGGLISYFRAFPLKRGVFDRQAMAASVELLKSGNSLTIFPEGGRVYGGELGPARSGVGYLAVTTGVTVLPLFGMGTDNLRDCLVRRRRVIVSHGRPIRIPPEVLAELQALDDKAARDAWRSFSETVLCAISELRDEVLDLPGS